MHAEVVRPRWVVAEYPTADSLLDAARKAREGGIVDIDTHTPYPLHRGDEALGLKRSKVPLIALCGGTAGGTIGFLFQAWMNGVDWPLNIGNRPPISAPAFIPITFECTVLAAALSIFFGLLALSRLPQPYHPAFDTEEFRSHSTHGFWLSMRVPEGKDAQAVASEVNGYGAKQVSVVEEQVD
jgi:hypothetical protein